MDQPSNSSTRFATWFHVVQTFVRGEFLTFFRFIFALSHVFKILFGSSTATSFIVAASLYLSWSAYRILLHWQSEMRDSSKMLSSNREDAAASDEVAKTADIDSVPGVKRANPHNPPEGSETERRDLEEYVKSRGLHSSLPKDDHSVPLRTSQHHNHSANQPPPQNSQEHHRTGAEVEHDLAASGHMPGLKRAGPESRPAGEEDEAGNHIPHKHTLSRLLHLEHSSANADR